jgi:integrase
LGCLPKERFHDLRHTYAVASIRAGDDPKTVSGNPPCHATLGHASVAFTLDVYGHVTGNMKSSSSQRMQEYIEKLKK